MPRGQGAGKDFEIYLEVVEAGARLNEHRVEHFDGLLHASHTDGWIECEPNTTFRIIIKDLLGTLRKNPEHVRGLLYIDGRMAASMYFNGTSTQTTSNISMRRNGVVGSYPLVSSAINTVGDPAAADLNIQQASVFSSIKLELQYGTSTGVSTGVYNRPVVEELGTVWEEHAKLGSMVNGKIDELKPVAKVPSSCTVQFTAVGKPFYEFNMKYCALVVLQLRGICPKPPAPEAALKPIATKKRLPPAPAQNRARSTSVSSASSSSSSSSSSSTASDDSSSDEVLAAILKAVAKAKGAKKRKAKTGKKEKAEKRGKKDKKEKKRAKEQKKEAKANEREGKSAKTAVDLTGDTDEEEGGDGSGAADKAAVKESEVTLEVKREMLDGRRA